MKEYRKVLSNAAVAKIGAATRQAAEIPDDQLDRVAGGYVESAGWAAGWNVVCPGCGAEAYNDFDSWIESEDDCMDGFKCRRCGMVFGIDNKGRIWGNI